MPECKQPFLWLHSDNLVLRESVCLHISHSHRQGQTDGVVFKGWIGMIFRKTSSHCSRSGRQHVFILLFTLRCQMLWRDVAVIETAVGVLDGLFRLFSPPPPPPATLSSFDYAGCTIQPQWHHIKPKGDHSNFPNRHYHALIQTRWSLSVARYPDEERR